MARLTRGRAALLAAVATAGGVLVIAGSAPTVAVGAVAFVAWSTLAGACITRWCGYLRVIDRMATGLAIGLAATVVIDQLAVTGLGVASRWTTPTVLAPLAIAEIRVALRTWASADPFVWYVVGAGALMAVGHEWVWTIPLGGCCLAVGSLLRHGHRRRAAVLHGSVLLVSAVGAIVAIACRKGLWWLTQNDTHFYEALAQSLARWGSTDFALAAGRPLRYHWFPYAWVGAVDRLLGADDYVILTRVAPVVATLGVVLCVVAVAGRFVESDRLGWVVVIFTISPVFGDWWWGIPVAMAGSFSQLFAMTWLAAVPLALVVWRERPGRGRLVILGLLLVMLVGGKATHAVVGASVVATSWVVLACRRDPGATELLRAGVLIAFAMALVGRTLFGGTVALRFLPTDWLPYVQGDLYDWHGARRVVAAAAYLGAMVGAALVAAVFASRRRQSSSAGWVALGVLLVGGLMSMFTNRLEDLRPNGLFALHSAVTLVWIGVAVLVAGMWQRSILVPVAVAAGLAAGVLAALPDLDSGSPAAVVLRVTRPVTAILPIVIAGTRVGSRSRRRDALGVGLVGCVVLYLLVQVAITLRDVPRSYREWRRTDAVITEGESEVARWIHVTTPPDAIFATNHMCSDPACDRPDYSSDAAFAVAVQRRMLVAAPLYALTYSGDSALDARGGLARLSRSLEFGEVPSMRASAALREAGVRWYVAERARSEGVDFSAVGDVRFENADYVVVELRDP